MTRWLKRLFGGACPTGNTTLRRSFLLAALRGLHLLWAVARPGPTAAPTIAEANEVSAMPEIQSRREQFCANRLVRLGHALRPLGGQHPDARVPLKLITRCLFGHRVSLSVVPAEWEEAMTVTPPNFTALSGTSLEGRRLLESGLCDPCRVGVVSEGLSS